MIGENDTNPILWVQAVGVDELRGGEIAEKLEKAVGGEYHIVVASEPIELLDREELLEALEKAEEGP